MYLIVQNPTGARGRPPPPRKLKRKRYSVLDHVDSPLGGNFFKSYVYMAYIIMPDLCTYDMVN